MSTPQSNSNNFFGQSLSNGITFPGLTAPGVSNQNPQPAVPAPPSPLQVTITQQTVNIAS